MSNARSPRESCCTTIGTRGTAAPLLVDAQPTCCVSPDASVCATSQLQNARGAEMADVVHREIVLPVPRERAWELLTDPRELAEWLADDVELEATPGGTVHAAWAGGGERT